MHNGVIPGHVGWPSFSGLKFRTDTDSEVILRWLEDGVKEKESIFEAIKRLSVALPNAASYAVAAMEKATGRLYLFRNLMRPINIARVANGIVFASTEDILKKALDKAGFGDNYILSELPAGEVFMFDTGTEMFRGKIFCPPENKTIIEVSRKISYNKTIGDSDTTTIIPPDYMDVIEIAKSISNDITQKEVTCLLNVMKKRMLTSAN